MAERESPEKPGEKKGDRARDHEVQHQPPGLPERFDEESRRDVRHDHNRNNPAKDETKWRRENHVGIAGDVKEIEVAVNQTLRPNDPETDRREREHDWVMDRDAEANRDEIKRDHPETGHDLQFGQGDDHHRGAQECVQDAVEPELFRRDGELAVDRQDQERIEPAGPDELGNVRNVNEEECLE